MAPPGVSDWSTVEVAAAFSRGTVAQAIDSGGLTLKSWRAFPSSGSRSRRYRLPKGPKVDIPPRQRQLSWFRAAPGVSEQAAALVERLLSPARYEALVRAGAGSIVPPYAYLTKSPFWDDDPNYPGLASSARGDPAQNFQFATPGSPAPLTLSVAAVRGEQILATLLRSVVSGELSPAAAATALGERARAVARQGYALQPPLAPTPQPEWWRILTSLQNLARGTPTPNQGN